MKAPMKWIICCTSVCMLAGVLSAQNYPAPVNPSKSDTVQSESDAGESKQFCRTKDLVGASVKDSQGQKVGDIGEIAINPKSGQTFAAIDIGRGRNALIPLQALNVTPARGLLRNAEVTLNKSKQEVESGPSVTEKEWQKLDSASFTRSIYSHYNLQAPSGMGGTSEDAMGGTEAGTDASSSGKKADKPARPLPGDSQP
jgi:hypothetical protein